MNYHQQLQNNIYQTFQDEKMLHFYTHQSHSVLIPLYVYFLPRPSVCNNILRILLPHYFSVICSTVNFKTSPLLSFVYINVLQHIYTFFLITSTLITVSCIFSILSCKKTLINVNLISVLPNIYYLLFNTYNL